MTVEKQIFSELFNVEPNEEIMNLLKNEVVINPNIKLPNFISNIRKLIEDNTDSNITLSINNKDNKGEDE